MKRDNYISWDEYFMGVALLSAQRSKDPNTQVGACIVDSKKRIVGVGYNGFPKGCSDEELPWERNGNFLDTKYAYVCHAELNAILNKINEDLDGCIIYVALFPCNECAKMIIQSGIKEVVYLSDKYKDTDFHKASQKMLEMSGVKLRKFISEKEITLKFEQGILIMENNYEYPQQPKRKFKIFPLPLQWWVNEACSPGKNMCKTTWWNVLTGKHKNQEKFLGRP
jgi:dCMP deaminase